MRMPVTLNVALLVVSTSLFYTYVGQLVPQKQLLPPAEVEVSNDLTTDQMVKVGFEVVQQKGMCLTCHTIGKTAVPGFSPGMPTINKPPIGLTDKEILCVIAWLQSLGGTPSVTMQTKLPDQTQG